MMFSVGDTAVYPSHGVADIVEVQNRQIGSSYVSCYQLHIRGTGLRITVPVDKAEEIGMRPVAGTSEIAELFTLLRDQETPSDRQTWNRRYRGFMEKIRTGSIFEVAEVYRDLSLLKTTKALSHGERQMLRTARDLLIRELAVAKDATEDMIADELDSLFKN
jgi:CarD family transcriptional regulator